MNANVNIIVLKNSKYGAAPTKLICTWLKLSLQHIIIYPNFYPWPTSLECDGQSGNTLKTHGYQKLATWNPIGDKDVLQSMKFA